MINKELTTNVSKLAKNITTLKRRVNSIDKLITKLENTYIEAGKPNWKKDKSGNSFLRMVRPATEEAPRKYIYIGSKPGRIAEAFAAVDRHNQLTRLRKIKGEIESYIHQIQGTMLNANDRLLRYVANDLPLFENQTIDLNGSIDQMDIDHARPTPS
ncbi:MAG: hypothetical protein GY781_13805 [Gammaproteobacteria bacterium]|nr:hypothetical protein [Gammaproteobacteria bacterium]